MPEASQRTERLIAAIDAFSETAYGSDSDQELADQRALAIERYLGRNIDPAPAGRSQVRDRTTFEVIEWTKPSLLRIFTAGSEVCKFDPVGPEDEPAAEQESDYVNHVITQKNNWHQVCNDWFSDALLLKNGYAYAYWDETRSTESEFYENLTDDALAQVTQDKEVEVVGHDSRPNEELDERNAAAFQQQMQQYQQMQQQAAMQAQQTGQPPQLPPPPQPPQPTFLHDIEIKRTFKRGSVKICTLAPERCKIDVNTPDHTLDQANYFEWFDWTTIGELRSAGYSVDDDVSDSGEERDRWDSPEETARDLYNEQTSIGDDSFADPSMRRVRVRHVWIRHDYNNDGINELQYCVLVGKELLYRRECEEIPVSSISPIPLAHRHVGMSLADSVSDIEDINTNITRQAIDNLNLSNTPRIAVSDRVNMADLLDVRVGGVIRVDGQPPQEFLPVTTPNVFPEAVQALTFFDSRRQNRTGINAYFQGTDANTLNKTASGISQLTNSAAQRVEMIARLFATGVERLFLIVHRLILQHGHAQEVFRLRNKWVTIDPAEWRKRNDVKIAVGLGTGNKDSLLAQLSQMFQIQMAAAPSGIVKPENLYATVVEMAKASSFATPERFVTDPATQPPQQPQPPLPLVLEDLKSKAATAQQQMELSFKAQDGERDRAHQAQMLQAKQAFDKWKEELNAQLELALEQMKQGDNQQARQVELTKLSSNENIKAAELQQNARRDSMDASESAIGEMVKQFSELQQAMQAVINSIGSQRVVGIEKVRDPKTGRMIAGRITRADGSSDEVTIQ